MIKILVKNRLRALIGSIATRTKNGVQKASVGKKIAFALLYLFTLACFFSLSTSMAILIGKVLIPIGAEWLYFAIFILSTLTIIFVFSIFETKSELFDCKDNELLLSMPIKPRDIVAARVAVVLVYNYIEEIIIMLPCLIVYGILSADVVGCIGIFIVSLFLPLISTSLSSFVGYAVARITKKLKRKNVVAVVICLIFLLVYMFGYDTLMDNLYAFLENAEASGSVANYPALYYIGSAATFDVYGMSIIIALSVLTFAIAYYLISKSYIKIVADNYSVSVNYKSVKIKGRSPLASLISKEISKFFSSVTYMINAGFALVLQVVIGIIAIIKSDFITTLAESYFVDENVSDPMTAALPIVIAALILLPGMVMISASALSLEGKNLWIIKTLPISDKTLLLSKTLPHIILSVPSSVITSVLLIIATSASPEYWLFFILTPLVATVAFAILGTVINTAFPRFDFNNETQPIKQSLAVFIVLSVVMVLTVATMVLSVVFASLMHPMFNALVIFFIYVLLSALLYFAMVKLSVKKYAKIEV